jgi:hypothetical protein
VVGRLNLHLHQYADDSQVYVSTSVDDCLAAVDQFTACLSDVITWMRASRLRLNPSKTQVKWLGSDRQLVVIVIWTFCQRALSSGRAHVTSVSSSTASCHCPNRTRRCTLSKLLPSAVSTASRCPFVVTRSYQNASRGVQFLPSGLLQLAFVRCC